MIPLRDDNPSRLSPIVSYALIGLCVLVFLWQFSLGSRHGKEAIYALGVIPAVLFGEARLPADVVMVSPWMTVLTSKVTVPAAGF